MNRRTWAITLGVWVLYLALLGLALLYHFPWRGPKALAAPTEIDKAKAIELIERWRSRPATDPMDAFLREWQQHEKKTVAEDAEELIQTWKSDRNTFDRAPCWMSDPDFPDRRPEDVTWTRAGADSWQMQLPPLRLAPRTGKGARAWDRFVVEMLYGLGAAAVIQVAVLGVAVVMNRRKSKSRLS